ncbi:hypothetical protein ACS126_03190 [Sphingobacterium lactis]|uniref:hypothetical protein n=1 Tax=Sphingobacterium TaxID=28453 RepID=UPI0021A3EB0A|nr:hypothetical protein [Sphingobacterium hotanense]MCT1525842.1 hypothetical protein [Sphingobacterium hotanense]
MNWTQFAMALTSIYGIYYGLNILWDFMRSGKDVADTNHTETLVFDETAEPQVVRLQMDEPIVSERANIQDYTPLKVETPPNIGVTPETSGAVKIKQLFELARHEMIEYTHAIPY